MKILHIFSGDLWAGAEVMVFTLLRRLNEFPDLKIYALCMNEGILAKNLSKTGIDLTVIPEQKYSLPAILLKAAGKFKTKKIDIIHSHRYKENLIALSLKKILKARILFSTLHGLPEKAGNKQKPSLLGNTKTHLSTYVLKKFFTTVAVSYEMRNFLIQDNNFYSNKLKVIHNGIELPAASNPLQHKAGFHIGTVGRMVPVKNYDLFLEIAARIKKKRSDVKFSILGDGPLKEQLCWKRNDLDLMGCMNFVEPVTDPFPFYQSLDIYLNTSRHEGIPLSILEAMACGLPVIAPNVGGIPEIFDDPAEGILVDKFDPEEFTDQCLTLINDADLRLNIGKRARQNVQSSFSAEFMADSYRQLYTTVP